ncbi:Putative serine/threonine-protein kinase, active [Colletotrichum destructivum]|uniref:Serine/threonine-protein kinase, active n=1 Tax=Colletotrichum destructivum TaxID=34406 RepID=A0AAX4I1V1_9PEZI|nr:Putative serine/threonine-protein kinase, active [Colletotrichum destructivum]
MNSQQSGLLPSDATTNAFTSSEFAQGLLRVHAVHTAREHSQVSSGNTNPFTRAELRQRLGSESTGPENDTSKEYDRPTQWPNVRIILYPSPRKPMSIKVTPQGSSNTSSQQPVILDAAAGPDGPAVSKLAVEQSGRDMGFHILVDSVCRQSMNPRMITLGDALNLNLYCDPGGDRIVIINMHADSIILERFAGQQDNVSAITRSVIELKPSTPTFLDPGLWSVFATAEELHILKLSILPRQYVSVTAVEAHTRRRQSSKRVLEASQPMKPVKKGKLEESSLKPGGTIAFQAAPASDDVGVVAVRGAVEKPCWIASSVRHPLEQLEPGAKANITDHRENYTLTYCETIMLMKNSLVFKAEHSRVPGVAVVKVLRTPSYPVSSGMPDESAPKIVHSSEMWLKEVKNHSKLSQHTAIVSLYGADARFLSLYMEHVDAPNLASYRLHCGNCTLGVDEAKRILADMSSAISYVHSQSIVHNDIKPANILFNCTRGAVLIDFGLSSGLKDSTVYVGGSPWYVPLEYAINGKRGGPGDVFALGVVMLFVLRKIPLPDLRPQLNWMIADVRKGGVRNAAWDTMFQWLGIVEKASRSSGGLQHAPLAALVREMLITVSKRISVSELLQRQGLE